MNIYELTLNKATVPSLQTELYFALADADAKGCDLIRMVFAEDFGKRERSAFTRILKDEKKKGKILLFSFFETLSEDTMETRYLNNKYPEIVSEVIASGQFGLLIKM